MGIDAVDLLVSIEARFGIAISDTESQTVRTVRDLVDLVCVKADGQLHAPRHARAVVESEVRRLVSQELGVPLDRARPETDFVRDLGMT